ncbi:unnamed protein product [Mytilus coruscus]|uniref:Integrase zinc-binding domain-containing protein n=1 Tax=Mytilus coruscus TaxID=42192 RepID=A0A6J8DKW2_MYTCO|nr:unnamed protein product [Mytilus coruscus]
MLRGSDKKADVCPKKLVNANQGLSVSRVVVPETITVHANSINILISASIGRGNLGQVRVINDSNQIVKLKEGKCIGKAESIEEVIDQSENPLQREVRSEPQTEVRMIKLDKQSLGLHAQLKEADLDATLTYMEDENDLDATWPYMEEDSEQIISNWVPEFSTTEIRRMQEEDDDISQVIQWLETGEEPTQALLRLSSPATRFLWLSRFCLEFHNHVLYYKYIERIDKNLCLVVPACLKKEILEYCHDDKVAGHLGKDKTIQTVKLSFIWHQMGSDITNYVLQ